MARLFKGEDQKKAKRLASVLYSNSFLGVTEAEAADLLGWDRRTVNNYLRHLQDEGKATKRGRAWFYP